MATILVAVGLNILLIGLSIGIQYVGNFILENGGGK